MASLCYLYKVYMDFSIQISESTKRKALFNIENLHFCLSFTTFALAILKGHADCGSEVCYREGFQRKPLTNRVAI